MPRPRIDPAAPLTATQRQRRWRQRRRERQERERLIKVDPLRALVAAWNDASEADQDVFLGFIFPERSSGEPG